VPPTPPLPPASQPPLLLPFFPPSEDLCVNIRGRRYGGPEQYVQVAIFLLPFFARYISSHCWIRADFFWMLVSALYYIWIYYSMIFRTILGSKVRGHSGRGKSAQDFTGIQKENFKMRASRERIWRVNYPNYFLSKSYSLFYIVPQLLCTSFLFPDFFDLILLWWLTNI
jgi:hypothetical protein